MSGEMGPYSLAAQAANELRAKSGVDQYDIAVVLGSGWAQGARALGEFDSIIPSSELAGFAEPTVAGHEGQVISLRLEGRDVALLSGRVHLYEGHDANQVCHGVRTLVMAGASTVVLTNACGGLSSSYRVGEAVMISDHINLMSTSPMEGDAPPAYLGSRFVDLSDLYSARLRKLAGELVPGLAEGIYAGFRGPHYETPAEIAMAVTMGASLVGMSTVLEAIAAKHLDAEVLGLSLVTDLVGVGTSVSHEEVLQAAAAASENLGTLLAALIPWV
jgi:purine-nucleoside phosphorylase